MAELGVLVGEARSELEATHQAREQALAACREAIRACGLAIRAVHRLVPVDAEARMSEADSSLRRAQQALAPYPRLAAAGFLHDAEIMAEHGARYERCDVAMRYQPNSD